MLKIENTDVYGWEAAIRGMRNSMNSWDKSDSKLKGPNKVPCCNCLCLRCDDAHYEIGSNDLDLMNKLVSAGTDHSKFMRMITVTCDIIAPLYWWKEFDTYKVGTVRNSCSTMHKIHEKEFTLDAFSHEQLTESAIENWLKPTIEGLNIARQMYVIKAENSKAAWWQMIQLLPSSYNQRATVQLNYQVLRNMYHARKNHMLDEWHAFCNWVEGLPYSDLITGNKE
jgi:hypothetical protein